ncbi:two-component system, NtrC family, sensor kinase [Candidatus Magnetomoraceae bacterium gMMP-1]
MGTSQGNKKKFFRRFRFQLTIGLLIAFILPHAVLSAYFHFQFSFTLKNIGKLNLQALSNSEKNTIDLFLQERLVNLFSIFHSNEFNVSPSKINIKNYLQNLRQVSDSFVDIGFLNVNGLQIGYAGPFPYLQGKDYSNEEWFKILLNQEGDYYISDIYHGFRNKPHFTIATRQMIDGQHYIIRSTLDPDKFYMFLRTITHGKEVESALINKKGLYQIVDPDRGELLGQSDYIPPLETKSGVEEINQNGNTILVAYSWLKETPWALLVRQPLSLAHAKMYETRRIMIVCQTLILLIIALAIWFTTSKMIRRAQSTSEKKDELRHQLIHASKLASVGKLATGVAHEINNPLAIIIATSRVIQDMLDPQFNLDSSPENIVKELDVIDSAVLRAKGITQQLLNFGRKNKPELVLYSINTICDKVLTGLMERELAVSNIDLKRNYDSNLPEVMLEPDQMEQVLLNFINNARDAISDHGTITVSTHHNEEHVWVTVKDDGIGMSSDLLKEIFYPFYTTKDVGKGTGLGLSVSLSIIESMEGTIDVQSLEGSGSSFTVKLPIT